MAGLDLDTIRHALSTAREMGYDEVELSVGDDGFHARLSRGHVAAVPVEAASPASSAPDEPEVRMGDIKAGVVGFYRHGKVPLEVGRTVKKGETVGLVHALGLNNEIECPLDGEVVEVLVRQEQPVMYGQLIARVRVAP